MGTEKAFEQCGFTDTAGWFGFGSAESERTLLPAACKASEGTSETEDGTGSFRPC